MPVVQRCFVAAGGSLGWTNQIAGGVHDSQANTGSTDLPVTDLLDHE